MNDTPTNFFRQLLDYLADPAEPMERGRPPKGEAHPNAKLTEEAVRHIRSSGRSGAHLAAHYGVSRDAISRVRLGKRWRHVA